METGGHKCVEEEGDDKMRSGRARETRWRERERRRGRASGRENIMNSDNVVQDGVKAAGSETD